MKTTNLMGREVIVTAGMTDASTGTRMFGVFASEADARSINADSLAIAVVSAADLTAEQIADAEANSEALSD